MSEIQWVLDSPVGPLHLVATQNGLRGIYWKRQSAPVVTSLLVPGESPVEASAIDHLAGAVAQLTEYFAGERREFSLTLDAQGTEFQKAVWAQLRRIPYGETRSYRDIARAIRREGAMRAVGTANGRNPLSIVVPCHRVIAADGTLAGFAGGLEAKRKLLALEAHQR